MVGGGWREWLQQQPQAVEDTGGVLGHAGGRRRGRNRMGTLDGRGLLLLSLQLPQLPVWGIVLSTAGCPPPGTLGASCLERRKKTSKRAP